MLTLPIDINAQDNELKTALHHAVIQKHERVMSLLVFEDEALPKKRQALNVDLPDEKGLTPLHYAAANGYAFAIEQLLKAVANSNL